MYQIAEILVKCLYKERINYQNKGGMGDSNANIGKQYVLDGSATDYSYSQSHGNNKGNFLSLSVIETMLR